MRLAWLGALSILACGLAHAQSDEIQVYDGHLAEPGIFNFTLHNNYALEGVRQPAFPGALVPDHSLNGVAEWAWGVTPWFEAGFYAPLYSYSQHGSLTFNGVKLRALFAVPGAAERPFFYGVNFEFSYNTAHWDETRYTQEIRGIVGWHLGKWDLILNPILDNSAQGGFGSLDFAPSTRVAYNFSKEWALAVEEYDDFGALRGFLPAAEQSHQVFAVVDHAGKEWELEGGIGFGLNSATDHLTLKLIVSHDLN